jgi:hypothetical protein
MAVEHDDEKDAWRPGDRTMKSFLGDAPFKGSRQVYFAIKLLVLVLAVVLALHFLFGVV